MSETAKPHHGEGGGTGTKFSPEYLSPIAPAAAAAKFFADVFGRLDFFNSLTKMASLAVGFLSAPFRRGGGGGGGGGGEHALPSH